MHLKISKIPWELLVALMVNAILLAAFLVYKVAPPAKVNPPAEISVDISDFSPPHPKAMPLSPPAAPGAGSTAADAIETLSAPANTDVMAQNAMQDFTPSADIRPAGRPGQTTYEQKQELQRIEQGIRTFNGINQVKAGLPEGALPAGHQAGASFQGRGDSKNRAKLLKRHGGNAKTESAVSRALAYLASVQNADGSWGSPESVKTGDVAALSSLALLTFFSHGETFQSQRYGEKIRKGCDFLIELANTPHIEYAGSGFGHAILTYALAEGFAVTGSISLRQALEARVKYMVAHQNKFGSFALNYDNSPQAPPSPEQLQNPLFQEIVVGESACDLSLLGWHIQALTAARNAGIQLDGLDKALALAAEALVKIHQAKKGGFSQGLNMRRFEASPDMTPVGLLGLYFLHAGNSTPARRAENLLEEISPPKWKNSAKFPLYRWYYQTQALFQSEKGRGKRWDAWNENLKNELIRAQQGNGGWPMPGGDNSFRVKNATDLTIYSSSLCALMLQVYYRYLPSYSIAESAGFSSQADDYDLGGGLITRLPGGADPLAAVILGLGTDNMTPIRFGEFNGVPADNQAPIAAGEFARFASMRSTVPIRKNEDWPQTLQPNQRLALFLDDLLPRNYKGHLRLLIGVAGDEKSAFDYQQSLEAMLNGKRLFNAFILSRRQLVEIVIPNDVMQPFGNILQIRNNGKTILAFDAAELSALNQVGGRLFLLADAAEKLPESLRAVFNSVPPEKAVFLKLSAAAENRQLLSEIQAYDPGQTYIGEYSAIGSEYMGNEFQLHYLRQTGREIIDWIAGGGTGVKINRIMTGGKLYDSIFQEAYPSVYALRQTAKLFEGKAHRIPAQIYPKYGEKPILFCSCAAAYNAPGVVTLVVAKRFPIPEETELAAIIPWDGETEMTIERGFLPEPSPFAGFAAKLESEKKNIVIANNTFRYSGVFPELTVIRLTRKGAPAWNSPKISAREVFRPELKFDHSSIRRSLPTREKNLKKQRIREASGFAAGFGQNTGVSKIPASAIQEGGKSFRPDESESVCLTFNVNTTAKRFESIYLPFGDTPKNGQYLSFYVCARAGGQKKSGRMGWVTLRFAVDGKLFSASVALDRWEQIVLPLNGINLAWKNIRILEPDGIFSSKLQSISYEINDVAVWAR